MTFEHGLHVAIPLLLPSPFHNPKVSEVNCLLCYFFSCANFQTFCRALCKECPPVHHRACASPNAHLAQTGEGYNRVVLTFRVSG